MSSLTTAKGQATVPFPLKNEIRIPKHREPSPFLKENSKPSKDKKQGTRGLERLQLLGWEVEQQCPKVGLVVQ